MAAPIIRYNDQRLYGALLVRHQQKMYSWVRTVHYPFHPKSSRLAECLIRTIKVAAALLAFTVTVIPALAGRFIQIIHYHTLSQKYRASPPVVTIKGVSLPSLSPCQLPKGQAYHGTDPKSAQSILRWGFDPTRTREDAKMGEAIYASVEKIVSAIYGADQLLLSLDLKQEEIAFIDDRTIASFRASLPTDFTMADVRKLCMQNGYRALQYDLQTSDYGKIPALAIYDPFCVSITGIKPALTTAPAVSMAI